MSRLTPSKPKRTRRRVPIQKRMVQARVRLPRYLTEAVDRICATTGLTPSQIIRDAIFKHDLVKEELRNFYAKHETPGWTVIPELQQYVNEDPAAI